MKKGLAIALFGIVIALMVSTNAFALIRCTKTCPTLYKAYLIGGSCTCIKTGSLYEEVQDLAPLQFVARNLVSGGELRGKIKL